MRLNPCFKQGKIVFVRENGNPLTYLAVVQDHSDGSLVPVVLFCEFVRDKRDAHMVFALNLHGALWTFTGFVEEPHDAL